MSRIPEGGGPLSRRAQYLQALGIDLWTLREPPAAPAAPSVSPAPFNGAPEAQAGAAPIPDPGSAWAALRVEVTACRRCSLADTRTQTVFGVGDLHAEVLVIGEAPGAEEDRQGEPFVGRAGQLLNSMLRALGRPRETVYIANVLKCRPPGNRDPSPAEVACCLPFLHRQIALLAPRLILVVGRIAAQNLLATELPIGRLRGQVHHLGAQRVPVVVTYHPAYLLRSPGEKRRAWADLKLARSLLAQAIPGAQVGAGLAAPER